MSLKRRFERDAEQTSPVKRCRCDVNIPQTPTQTPSSVPCLPTTPYTPYPLQPSDSPTNPFKRKKKVETLPPVTSFSKHIPLRFQFHRRNVGFRKGGVHRIVQVPLNYTFTHLRGLIAWLFDTPTSCASRKPGDEGYLFEVKTNVAMESPLRKPGMIKTGVTSVKLSNVRDPWRKRYGQNADDEDELDDECDADAEEGICEMPDEEADDWIWADEDDHTLEHVWVTGVSADRGIIYHHSSDVQIHISVNTMKLPRRRGKSNVPYVFFARGRVHLSPRPLPRLVFPQLILHTPPVGPSIGDGKRAYSIPESPKRSERSLPNIHSPEGEELTDADEDVNPFHDDHSFFCSPDPDHQDCQASPLRKVTRVRDTRRSNHSSEVVYVEDSDDEAESRDSDDDESEDETIEVYDRLINPHHWNEFYYTYGRYLLSFLDDRGRSFDHIDDEYFEERAEYDPFDNDDDDDDKHANEEEYVEEDSMHYPIEIEDEVSTPELTSSTSRMSPLPPSSPPTETLSSSPAWHHHLCSERSDGGELTPPSSVDPLGLSPDSSLELHPSIIALHYPNKRHTITPAPPKARKHRVRIDRLEKRLERFKKGKYLCENDEVGEEEVDELLDELLDEEEEVEEGDGEDDDTERFWKFRDHWDPFGDEIEI